MLLHTALFIAELHNRADVVVWHEDVCRNYRLTKLRNLVDRWQLRGVVDIERFAVRQQHFVDHGRRGRDQVEVVLSFQPLLDDLHVQHTQESAAEAESQRSRGFRLEMQCRVVKPQFLQCFTKAFVIV